MARLTKERKTLNSARGEEAVPDLVDAIMSNLRAVVDEYFGSVRIHTSASYRYGVCPCPRVAFGAALG